MADDANVSKVIDALVKALAFTRDDGNQKAGVDDARGPFKYAFCCGEAGGIAAAASIFGSRPWSCATTSPTPWRTTTLTSCTISSRI